MPVCEFHSDRLCGSWEKSYLYVACSCWGTKRAILFKSDWVNNKQHGCPMSDNKQEGCLILKIFYACLFPPRVQVTNRCLQKRCPREQNWQCMILFPWIFWLCWWQEKRKHCYTDEGNLSLKQKRVEPEVRISLFCIADGWLITFRMRLVFHLNWSTWLRSLHQKLPYPTCWAYFHYFSPIYLWQLPGLRQKTPLPGTQLEVMGCEAVDALKLMHMGGLQHTYLWVHLQKETIDTELKSLSIVFKSLAPSTCSFDEVKVKVPELPCMKEVDLFPTLTVIRTQSLVVQARGITPQLLSLPAVHLWYTSIGIDIPSLDFAYVDLSSRAMQYLIRTTAVTNSIVTLNLMFCGHHSILAGLILPKLEVLSIDVGYGLSGIFTFVMRHQSLVCLTVDDTPSFLSSLNSPSNCHSCISSEVRPLCLSN